jgi:hypothetical protein
MSPFYRLTELEVTPAMAAAGSTNPPVRQQLRLPDLPKDVVSVSTFNRVPATHDAVSAALLADAPRTPGEVSRKLTVPRTATWQWRRPSQIIAVTTDPERRAARIDFDSAQHGGEQRHAFTRRAASS